MVIEIVNIDEFKKVMQQNQAKIQNLIPEGIRKATLFLHARVKESIARGTNAPVAVDTGRFLSSIDFTTNEKDNAIIFTDVEYAKFIEYGTSRMKSRPHFRNTVFKEKQEIRDQMGAEIKSI
jgi:phage gpG-like protein